MPSKLVAAPSGEPVSLDEAKIACRAYGDVTGEDALISELIVAARQDAEEITRRALVTQQWKLVLDRFPVPNMNVASATWYGPQWGVAPGPLTIDKREGETGSEIYLIKPPLQSVDSITYIDQNGVQQTLDPSQYIVDDVSEPARITPAYSTSWPATRQQANAVEITFTCGYGKAAAVPAAIKRWMKLRVGTIFNNREEVAILNRGKLEVLPYVDNLLAPYRVLKF